MKYIIDIQDLWPESFSIAIKNKLLQKMFYPMKKYIDYAYAKADSIVAVSQTYVDRALLVNKKLQSGTSIYLGNNSVLFDRGCVKYSVERNDNDIWVGYVGSMGNSYDIGCVIDAIYIWQESKSTDNDIRFVLCGDGEKRRLWESYAKEKGVCAEFYGTKPYEEMAGILCSCDIVVNPIVSGSVASIINKVGDYALSGLPVINSQESLEYRNLIEKYNCGINCECGNAEDIAKAIDVLVKDKNLRFEMGKNHRLLGEKCFSRENSYQKIVNLIEDTTTNGKIIIIANFPGVLDGMSNGRFTFLAEMLSERGYNVELITSTFNHAHKKHNNVVTGKYKSKITLVNEPGYKKNISLKRLYSHWIWGRNVRKYLDSLEQRPSVIYCAIPSLTAAVLAAKYCKRRGCD